MEHTKKPWYIDRNGETVYFETNQDLTNRWWDTFQKSKDYASNQQRIDVCRGEFVRTSTGTGVKMTWLDHHSQAFNDSNRPHPQRSSSED